MIRLAVFLQWWRTHHRGLAHAAMQRCAAVFDELDPYAAGTLTAAGAEELRVTLVAEHPWIDLAGAGAALRFECIPKVTPPALTREHYPGIHHGTLVMRGELLSHWKSQVGAEKVELPVFPEYLSRKIEEAEKFRIKPGDEVVRDGGRPARRVRSADRMRRSAAKEPELRSGRALWQFLIPRLKTVARFSAVWGKMHELSPEAEDLLQADETRAQDPADEEEAQLRPWIYHPEHAAVLWWRRFQLLALLYVLVAGPLAAGFGVPGESQAAAPTTTAVAT